jgi:hypothetical protein
MNYATETGSLVNHFMTSTAAPVMPNVGDAATLCFWTDRSPATVIEVKKVGQSNIVFVQVDKAIRTDKLGMSDSQDYTYERDPEGRVSSFRYNHGKKNWELVYLNPDTGRYVKSGGYSVYFGRREKFHDYSF